MWFPGGSDPLVTAITKSNGAATGATHRKPLKTKEGGSPRVNERVRKRAETVKKA